MGFLSKPRAAVETRTIQLDGQDVSYLLKRSPKRRTIGMRIDHRGLTVNAPQRAAYNHLEKVLQERSGWLLDKLREWQASQPEPMGFCHGETLLFLGSEIRLCLMAGGLRAKPLLSEDDTLTVKLPDIADAAAVRRKLEQWYRAEARRHFIQRLEHYAGRMGLALSSLALSNARSRWGSCNSRGEIRLSWRLIQAPISQIDYVVVHELAHIRELNHSPRFWAIVEETLPRYEAAHQALKAGGERYHRF
ncbi:MAG TPA: SprT family zinc-dependent metalloprotease [Sulfuricella sp.]|nr:SprT family zinc-dependent metalloprotease [Sulfuricella sp.]